MIFFIIYREIENYNQNEKYLLRLKIEKIETWKI